MPRPGLQAQAADFSARNFQEITDEEDDFSSGPVGRFAGTALRAGRRGSQGHPAPRSRVRDHDGKPRLQPDSPQPERAVHQPSTPNPPISATNYFAVAHPSLTNYLEIVGGSNFGVLSDNSPDWHNGSCDTNLRTGVAEHRQPCQPRHLPDLRRRHRRRHTRLGLHQRSHRASL